MVWLATQGDGRPLEIAPPSKTGSGGEAFIAMVKPADLRNGDHLASVGRLDGANIRALFVEREMGPRAVIVIDVRDQDPAQMPLIDHDHMVKTLAANRADRPLDVSIGSSCRMQMVRLMRSDFWYGLLIRFTRFETSRSVG